MGPVTAGIAASAAVVDEKDLERQFERQMGCMAGFLQLFDRHQILAGKRVYAAKRLPSSPAAGSRSPSEMSEISAASFIKEATEECPSSPERETTAPATAAVAEEIPSRPSIPLPVFDFKEGMRSTWKLREAPRLSLDSRAIVDAKGKLRPRNIRTPPPAAAVDEQDQQRRSPSVVARLMGLEALPGSSLDNGETGKSPQLRRSASESRVQRDLSKVFDPTAFRNLPPQPQPSSSVGEMDGLFRSRLQSREMKPNPTMRTPVAPPVQRRNFFEEFYPEPKMNGSVYGEVERRLRMRGIDEPARDLETLKQILEAVQLKGLLHSRPHDNKNSYNYVIDENNRPRAGDRDNAPIVVMKPAPKSPRRPVTESPPPPMRSGPSRPPQSPRQQRNRADIERNSISNNGQRRPVSPVGSPARRRPGSPEPQKHIQPQRNRINKVQSPRASPRRTGPDSVTVRSRRSQRLTAEISVEENDDDVMSVISESSYSTSSQLDFDRCRVEGRNLLERCDKLLSSIAAFTSAEKVTAGDQQPSPISVLDSSSFLSEENSPPVTASKRSINFKDQLEEWEDRWKETVSAIKWKSGERPDAEDSDFIYVSDIFGAYGWHRELNSDLFLDLEKRYQELDLHLSVVRRHLLFDTVVEIVEGKKSVSPWDAFASSTCRKDAAGPCLLLYDVWVELRRVKENAPADDLNEVTNLAITKDMASDRLWETPAVELSEAVLHIERQLFKDLVADAIKDLAAAAARRKPQSLPPRRKLVF